MLNGQSSILEHRAQNVALLLLSLVLLPLTTTILQLSLLIDWIFPSQVIKDRRAARSTPGFIPKSILVTGVGMTKGLAISRFFYRAGHDVIGADFEPTSLPTACGRVSRSLKIFYRVTKPEPSPIVGQPSNADPYIASLLQIVRTERIDLWISCSGVASAVEDGLAKEIIESKTTCRAIQFDVSTTQTLHEKHTFIAQTQDFGLTIPETHTVTSRSQVEEHLRSAPQGRKYILKTIGVDDSVRGDMTLLPLDKNQGGLKATNTHISKLRISKSSPWILQQFIPGHEFCTHSIIVSGEVKAFVACPSAELLMHYTSLPSYSPLSRAMLNFTKTFAERYGDGFTGHLSFDFLVDDRFVDGATEPEDVVLYPIECNPRAHTAVCLFEGTATEMVEAYLCATASAVAFGKKEVENRNGNGNGNGNGNANGLSPSWDPKIVYPNFPDKKYYWIGHDLIEFVVLPFLRLITLQPPQQPQPSSPISPSSSLFSNITTLINGIKTFTEHVLFWSDGTYELWDPMPVWWLYHVFWPVQFAMSLVQGTKWSRVNVSTTKMFMC